MAYSVTMLSWGLIEYRDAYEAAGELAYGLDCIKWPLDYFIKAHVGKNKFYGQVCWTDHLYWHERAFLKRVNVVCLRHYHLLSCVLLAAIVLFLWSSTPIKKCYIIMSKLVMVRSILA